jgi:hypothetical protein
MDFLFEAEFGFAALDSFGEQWFGLVMVFPGNMQHAEFVDCLWRVRMVGAEFGPSRFECFCQEPLSFGMLALFSSTEPPPGCAGTAFPTPSQQIYIPTLSLTICAVSSVPSGSAHRR